MTRMPTMMDVAKRAETTVTTVSRVVNNAGYVATPVRVRVQAAIAEVGFVPNANARTLRTKRSRTIGIVVGDLMNPYSVELANAVTGAAVAYGYTTFIAAATDDQDSDVSVIEAFHRQRVDGLVVATLQTASSDAALLRLAKHGMPIVLVGRELEQGTADSISAGFRRGGLIGAQHLIDLGHRRIAFVGAELNEASRVTRLQGYIDALEAAGLRVRPEYVIGSNQAAGSPRYSRHGTGHQAVLQLLKLPTPPTAIFARNDHTAFGALQALSENGLSVPGSMSVVGFDNLPMSDMVTPTLTSVSQPTKEEGRAAVDCLLRRLEHPEEDPKPRKIVLDCTLVVRGSSAQLQSKPKTKSVSTSAKHANGRRPADG